MFRPSQLASILSIPRRILTSHSQKYCSSHSSTSEGSGDIRLPKADEGQGFDETALESIIKSSVKDMPVDITNPYERDRIQCLLCRYKVELDYKNVKLLSQFVSSFTGNIYERHITRLCKTQQDRLVKEIRRSRLAGFMPVMFKSVEMMQDPKLFDPNNPIKPHPF